jgi:DNA-directed RNA polymerase specialized sigma subunit
MEKSIIEKYLKIYPNIDEELIRIESEIKFLDERKMLYLSDKTPQWYRDSMMETVNASYEQWQYDLNELKEAVQKICKALPKMNCIQKKVIELRFWNGKEAPTKWCEVAQKLTFHEKSIERIYKKIINTVLAS